MSGGSEGTGAQSGGRSWPGDGAGAKRRGPGSGGQAATDSVRVTCLPAGSQGVGGRGHLQS